MLVVAGAFDLLFFFFNELPATVPVALVVIIIEGWQRWPLSMPRLLIRSPNRRPAGGAAGRGLTTPAG